MTRVSDQTLQDVAWRPIWKELELKTDHSLLYLVEISKLNFVEMILESTNLGLRKKSPYGSQTSEPEIYCIMALRTGVMNCSRDLKIFLRGDKEARRRIYLVMRGFVGLISLGPICGYMPQLTSKKSQVLVPMPESRDSRMYITWRDLRLSLLKRIRAFIYRCHIQMTYTDDIYLVPSGPGKECTSMPSC
jgi:hypothetical protein